MVNTLQINVPENESHEFVVNSKNAGSTLLNFNHKFTTAPLANKNANFLMKG